jgi:hypothetical protein
MITIAGTDQPQYRVDPAPGRDDWDTWNNDRDRRVQTAQGPRQTNQYYTGTEDLDPYGSWSEVPDYGNVWFPNSDSDWAPYRDGSWVYEPYYGWTWVSYEPWGWAPYHYGRWFVYGGRWGWYPGPVYGGYRPVWGPAYVSFFGWGGGGFGLSVGFGFGGGWGRVGWLPIGPGDWYHPWYGRYGGRYNVVDIHNVYNVHEGFGPLHGGRGVQYSNLHDAFNNNRIRGGISSMNGGDFGRGRVPANQERISEASFRQSSMMTGRMPMAPSRESYSPTGRAANPSSFHNVPSSNQHFFGSNRGNSNTAGNGFSRPQNNNGFSQDRNSTHTVPQQGGNNNWHTFTPPTNVNRSNGASPSQGFNNGNRGSVDKRGNVDNRGAIDNRGSYGNNGGTQNRPANNGSFRPFTPPTQGSQPQNNNGRDYSRPDESNRTYQQQQAPRGPSNNNSYSRPQLNMRQPVVTPRGGNPSGNNAPRSGGNFSAPRGGGYQAPRGGGGGNSAPRGGNSGGGNHGGGGGGGHHR